MSYLIHLRNRSAQCHLLCYHNNPAEASERHHEQVSSHRGICSHLSCQRASLLPCDKGHHIYPYNLQQASHTSVVFLEELPLLNATLTAHILLLFIWLLFSTVQSFPPSICTGCLIINLFALYIIITAYLELSPWTTQAAEGTENNQADRHF